MHAPLLDPRRAARRFGAFAVLCMRAIEGVKRGELTSEEAAAHVEQVAKRHRLRETGAYDPKLVDMTLARLRGAKPIG